MKDDFSNVSDENIVEFYKIISKNVKKERIKNNLTQLELALNIGISSVAFYCNCENNQYNKHFNLEHLYKIAKALNINIENFFIGVKKLIFS